MTNQEKSKVIADKVEIKWHNIICVDEGMQACSCGDWFPLNVVLVNHFDDNPDFFTPEGQVVLAGALLKLKGKKSSLLNETYYIFTQFLNVNYPEYSCNVTGMLTVIAETKLAELFYEFVEGEKDG